MAILSINDYWFLHIFKIWKENGKNRCFEKVWTQTLSVVIYFIKKKNRRRRKLSQDVVINPGFLMVKF
jgi:hypothetical protein